MRIADANRRVSTTLLFGLSVLFPVVGSVVVDAHTPAGASTIQPTAYVTNNDGNSVTPIELATNTAGTAISLGGNAPSKIAITPDGQTAYTITNNNSVTPINLATGAAGTTITGGMDFAVAIAITPNGQTAYVANSGGNQ